MKKAILLSLYFAWILCGPVDSLRAATKTWLPATGGAWSAAANWSGGTVPAAGDDIVINSDQSASITAVPNLAINSLTVSGNCTLEAAGTTGTRTLTVGGNAGTDLVIDAGKTLTLGTRMNLTLATNATAGIAGGLTLTASRVYNTSATDAVTTVTGNITNAGVVNSGDASHLVFQSGANYNHSRNGGTVPAATWNNGSTCLITGIVSTAPGGLNQSFYHFTWDCGGQTSGISTGADLTTINGNFTIANTNSEILRSDAASSVTLNIGDDLIMNSGSVVYLMTNGAGDKVVNVAGDFLITSGILRMSNAAGTGTATLNVAGNLTYTGGTVTALGPGTATLVFNGTLPQIYISGSTGGALKGSVNVTVSNGSSLILPPGQRMTVPGTTNLNGPDCLTIQSDATSTGSFIDNGLNYANGATVKCQRYMSGGEWHYLCIPFASIHAWTYFSYYMKYYSEPEHHFRYVIAPSDSTLQSTGLGYAMWLTFPTTINQVNDSLNTGTVNIPVTRSWDPLTSDFDGWNLVGNPYPSAINLSSADITWTNVESSAWFWDPGAGNYKVWTSGGGGSHNRYCPAGQGFFVHCNDAGATQLVPGTGTLTLVNTARVHSSTAFLKLEEEPDNLLRMSVSGTVNGFEDETDVLFMEGQSADYDAGFDAEKIDGDVLAPQLNTTSMGHKLSVNALSFLPEGNIVPMEFRSIVSGEFTLEGMNTGSFDPGATIWLEDLKENVMQDLRTNPVYTFIHQTSDEPGRFLLHFNDISLGNPGALQETGVLKVYAYESKAYVRFTGTGDLAGNIFVYDLLGRTVYQNRLSGTPLQMFDLSALHGYYVIRVISDQGVVSARVVL